MSDDTSVINGGQVAIYIDFDNIVISRYDELHGAQAFRNDRAGGRNTTPVVRGRLEEARLNLDAIVDFASSFGIAAITRAYADWSMPVHASYATETLRRSVDLVQLFPMTGTKNGADIRLAIDAIDDLARYPDLTHVVVVAGDSDYVALAQRAKRLGRRVIGIGVVRASGLYWRHACDEFRYYSLLPGVRQADDDEPPAIRVPSPVSDGEDPAALLTQALELLGLRFEREWTPAGTLKNQLLRLNPSFDETALGYANFSAFLRAMSRVVDVQEGAAGYDVRLRASGAEPTEMYPGFTSPPAAARIVELRNRLLSPGSPKLTEAEERQFPAVLRTMWELADPALLGQAPRPALLARLTADGMDAATARHAAHVLGSSGLPVTLHDSDYAYFPNPAFVAATDEQLVHAVRRWTADRARNLEGFADVTAEEVLEAVYGETVPAGAAEDVAESLALASVGTMRQVLAPRILHPQILWDIAEAAAQLGERLAGLTAETFASALSPGLQAMDRDPETVPMDKAYLSLSEAGLCGDTADAASVQVTSGHFADIAGPVVRAWARRLLADRHLVPAELTSMEAFYRLTLPDRVNAIWRDWVRDQVSAP